MRIGKLKIFFLAATFILLAPALYLSFGQNRPSPGMVWGVSFSQPYASSLGLEWRRAYEAILDDLQVSHLRLSSYWEETEPEKGHYRFEDLDWQIREASRRGKQIILTLGMRQPRWPECQIPAWAKDLPAVAQDQAVLDHIKSVVIRYRDEPAIAAWQVENEFFVKWFGQCPERPARALEAEIALVKSLDKRPIVITDSGELSLWFQAGRRAEIFGTTMYRRVYGPFGQTDWPYPPVYYSRLGSLVGFFTGFDRMIIAELQAEPWAKRSLLEDATQVNFETLSPDQFRRNLEYARNSGIGEAYLWGAEWWYYMKEKRGIADYWEIAKSLWVDTDGLD